MDSICNPPFHEAFTTLMEKTQNRHGEEGFENELVEVEECELPVIDVSCLEESDEVVRERCKCEMARASKEWGFFQVVRHGISGEVFNSLRLEQEKVFKQPFDEKNKEHNFSAGSYRWGTPTATCIRQFSWSEAFHIPLTDILGSDGPTSPNTLTSTIEQFASNAYSLAQTLADILAEKMGRKSNSFQENCSPTTCYVRLNRYPPYPMASRLHGLVPHTDSCFLTILHQDQVRGLQLVKDGKWIAVKPNPDALTINIGDLFQAWSNGIYRSVEHRVVTNPKLERFSIAYFFCPFDDTIIESCSEPSIYKKFSYQEYRQQVRDDVQKLGTKIGLSNFLIHEGTT